MFGELVKRKSVMRNEASNKYRASRFTHHARQKGQAVLLATLIMFVVAAVGAGFILFVQSSMNLSQRARQEEEAFLLARAGLLFADRQLTEKGADWRPSVMVAFDDFEQSRGWHRPDKDNDWYGKYAARQVRDLLGTIQGAGGSFLLKVKYVPEQQVIKIISIGRPAPNSPVFRRLVAYKPLPSDWIWVTAKGDGDNPDPLLISSSVGNYNYFFARLGQEINWRLALNANQWIWLNAERDPLVAIITPNTEPYRLNWLRLRTWLGPSRLPAKDATFVFTSTIRVNSDLLWTGITALQVTDLFAGEAPLVEVARLIQHDRNDYDGDNSIGEDTLDGVDNDNDGQIDEDPLALVLVYENPDTFHSNPNGVGAFLNGAVPSDFGTPPGNGFYLFPIGGVPRYMDGWERLGGVLPVRWVFNFPRRITPRTAPSVDLRFYLAQTRDAAPPASHYGYHSLPLSLNVLPPTDPNAFAPFFTVRNDLDNPNQTLTFRGIYIDNGADRQFTTPSDAPDVDGDGNPDPQVFTDENNDYRPELAQVYDWTVKPPVLDPNDPTQLHPRRRQLDSGWLEDIDDDNDGLFSEDPVNSRDDDNDGRIDEDPDANYVTERNMVEVQLPFTYRTAAPNFYVPPGVEVRFDVYYPDPQNNPTLIIQRTWLIRHDGQPFHDPNGNPLSNRLCFVDAVQLGQFDADNDGRFGEDPINNRDDDGDGFIDEDPAPDADGDGNSMEDPINFLDDDGDNLVDEDPPHTAFINGQVPQIVIFAEGNIRVSGQVAVAVKIVTPETIYIEGPLHSVTSNATIELLAKRNICLNFAAARTPIPVDGLNQVLDRATLLPRFKVSSLAGYVNLNDPLALQGADYLLPNAFSVNLPIALFADLLGGSVNALAFPEPQDRDGNRIVDAVNGNNPLTAQVDFSLTGANLPLSQDLQQNFQQLLNGVWTLRLVLLHRGMAFAQDPNSPNIWQVAPNPWTNLAVYVCIDEDGDGNIDLPGDANHDGNPDDDGDGQVDEDSVTRVYGPGEPMRTFPVASRWYQGDVRQLNPNDPATAKEWGIMDIPIPPTAKGLIVDRDIDGQITVRDFWLALQRLHVVVVSPVANEVIPQGRTPVRYELASIKLALYDENGLSRPIWQIGSPFLVFAQTMLAESGTIGFVPPPYFDPTAHPSWQQLVVSNQPQWQTQFRYWQRLWSFYYLRQNSVRWTSLFDPATLPPAIAQKLPTTLLPQSIPVLAGQLIMRVTPQAMLWRLAGQGAFGNPNNPQDPRPNALGFAWETGLDKAALPYLFHIDPTTNTLRPLQLSDLQPPTTQQPYNPPVFVEVPRTMFASTLLWSWRAASPVAQGVLNLGNAVLPPFYKTSPIPNLRLSPGFFAVMQQQVGED
ncbi:MAG: hypothetical protein DFNUSKGM_002001 [Candidatus Fervidibacter sacchari]